MTTRTTARSLARITLSMVALALCLLVVTSRVDALWAFGQSDGSEYLDDAGRIIGSPDPGPEPEHSGERGGSAQLLTLAVMLAGVAFIAWRIRNSLRRSPT